MSLRDRSASEGLVPTPQKRPRAPGFPQGPASRSGAAIKPSSVRPLVPARTVDGGSRAGLPAWAAISLTVVSLRRRAWMPKHPSPAVYPPPSARTRRRTGFPIRGSCVTLHAVGFTVPPLSPAERCALTAPFHPYLISRGTELAPSVFESHRRFAFCCTFPRPRPPSAEGDSDGWALPTTVSCRARTFLKTCFRTLAAALPRLLSILCRLSTASAFPALDQTKLTLPHWPLKAVTSATKARNKTPHKSLPCSPCPAAPQSGWPPIRYP